MSTTRNSSGRKYLNNTRPNGVQIKIAVVGNLANVGLKIAGSLREAGLDATLYVLSTDFDNEFSNPKMVNPEFKKAVPKWIRTIDVPLKPENELNGIHKVINRASRWLKWRKRQFQWWRELRKFDVIQSINMSPPWLARINRPTVAWATGSDLWETAAKSTREGAAMRNTMRKIDILLHQSDPLSVQRAVDLKIKAAYPTRLTVDTVVFSPRVSSDYDSSQGLRIFSPSRLDWVNSNGRQIKANDRLIRGFALFLARGHKGQLIYVERGNDISATRQLISDLGINEHVTSYDYSLPDDELSSEMQSAHVVADQFSIGTMGGIALEGMSCAKPVLVAADPISNTVSYEDPLPLLHARNAEQVADALSWVYLNTEEAEELGAKARKFIQKYHTGQKVAQELIWHYERITGACLNTARVEELDGIN